MEERVNLESAREKLVEGVELLYKAVSLTFGPSGRAAVIIDGSGIPHVTKDGATVAMAVSSPDKEVNCGIELLRQASLKTAKEAGDGTTTSVILARELLRACMDSGKSLRQCSSDLDLLYDYCRGYIDSISCPIDDLYTDSLKRIENIATLSANNDMSVGKIIRDAYWGTGLGVNIILEEGFNKEDIITTTKGIRFNKGYESAYLANDMGRGVFDAVNCLIVLYEQPVLSFSQINNRLDLHPGEPVLVISPRFSSSVVQAAVGAKRSGYDICLVEADGWGENQRENIRDISSLLGRFTFSENGIYTGYMDSVHVDADSTCLIGGKEDPSWRVEELKGRLSKCDMEDVRKKLEERIAVLGNGTCTITIGASTESEMKEKKDRYEDAICAVRSAVKSGILPGGGVVFYHLSSTLEVSRVKYFASAMQAPFKLLCKYSFPGDDIKAGERDYEGFDFLKGIPVDNAVNAGIIDPAEVELSALRNAISVVKLILSVDCIVEWPSPSSF